MKCNLQKLTVKKEYPTQWKCIDCGLELNATEIRHPIVCSCGRVERSDGKVLHIRKLPSMSRYARSSADATYLNRPGDIEDARQRFEESKRAKGRRSWRMLHTKHDSATPEELQKYFELWLTTIPKDCNCVKDANALLTSNPPDFSSPRNFWLWGWNFHNLVNAKLTEEGNPHPRIDLAQAEREWLTKYAFWQQVEYGGLETWSLTLNKFLPAYGVVRKFESQTSPDPVLESRFVNELPNVTLADVIYHEKPIITSFIENVSVHKSADLICVAHGTCEYTKKWIMNASKVARSFVGVSKEVSSCVESWTGKPCKTIENGVDTSRLIPSSSRKDLRSKFGLPEHDYVIGYSGRCSSEKLINYLMEAVCRIPHAHLAICGWTNYDVQAMAKACGMSNRFTFIPAITQIADFLECLDTYVSCSENEGFGLSTMEAMMYGLPVASSNVGIVKQLVQEHGDIGISVFEPKCAIPKLVSAILNAEPCSINLSDFTGTAMAKRWEAFLKERVQ